MEEQQFTKANEHAFPLATTENTIDFHGLTKREYIAAKAMAALIEAYGRCYGSPTANPQEVCREAVSYADGLLSALEG